MKRKKNEFPLAMRKSEEKECKQCVKFHREMSNALRVNPTIADEMKCHCARVAEVVAQQ